MKRKLLALTIAAGAVLGLTGCDPQTVSRVEIGVVFGDQAGAATKVATCESGLDPAAVSAGGGNHGLFQINDVHKAAFTQVTGQPWSAVYDAHWNTLFAKHLVDGQGWRPWSCSRVL
jgi:hypothetical protein